ncbi:MAG: hypothetical protein WCD02_18755 [Terriglobales bacterium]
MSTPRNPALPPAILPPDPDDPGEHLDCPESLDDELFTERKSEIAAEAARLYGTPSHVLDQERRRTAELEHARALAGTSRSQVRKERKVSTPGRLEEYGELMRKAAVASGDDVAQFCALLDLDGVPTPRDWPERSWRKAYENRQRWSAIRGVKLRALRSNS